jgi:hypothetical protein
MVLVSCPNGALAASSLASVLHEGAVYASNRLPMVLSYCQWIARQLSTHC